MKAAGEGGAHVFRRENLGRRHLGNNLTKGLFGFCLAPQDACQAK